jgi:hypothetical protein
MEHKTAVFMTAQGAVRIKADRVTLEASKQSDAGQSDVFTAYQFLDEGRIALQQAAQFNRGSIFGWYWEDAMVQDQMPSGLQIGRLGVTGSN